MATKIQLNLEQKDAFKAIQKFIDHPLADTFVLKGYAGTGKTFLMQYLANWLKEKEHQFALLASTGRAATVLRGKTGLQANTVHGELYSFSQVSGDTADIPDDAPAESYGQMQLQFSLRQPDITKKVYIVDESSMLANVKQTGVQSVAFGTGFLLEDFFQAVGKNKIVFVGDPGQLPPVGQTFSPALDMDWLAKKNRTALSVTLEKIERQDPDNDLLVLASYIRNMRLSERFPKLPAKSMNNVKVLDSDRILFNAYRKRYQELGSMKVLAIARSNKMVANINRAIRRDLYGQLDMPLQPDDILMVIQNNYSIPFTNGDFAQVLEVGLPATKGSLKFQNIKIKGFNSQDEYEILICLTLLNSNQPNLTEHESKELLIEFSKTMRNKGIKPNSDEYKEEMKNDKYLNCLRAKYGYAVTCHKAQGGEWDEIYLFLEKSMYAMHRQELYCWWYTAITRARQNINLANNWWIS